MLRTETLADGRVRHWSDAGMMIRQLETDSLYEDAVDVTPLRFSYAETDVPIPDGGDATPADYEAALARLGVET